MKQRATGYNAEIEDMVQYMVFADERLLDEPIAGVSTFTNTFPHRGPRDHQGRSLRDFDLEKRLFKYPLSYMIYSAAFDALPGNVREQVYRRLYEVLSSKDETPIYAKLAPDAKRGPSRSCATRRRTYRRIGTAGNSGIGPSGLPRQ